MDLTHFLNNVLKKYDFNWYRHCNNEIHTCVYTACFLWASCKCRAYIIYKFDNINFIFFYSIFFKIHINYFVWADSVIATCRLDILLGFHATLAVSLWLQVVDSVKLYELTTNNQNQYKLDPQWHNGSASLAWSQTWHQALWAYTSEELAHGEKKWAIRQAPWWDISDFD